MKTFFATALIATSLLGLSAKAASFTSQHVSGYSTVSSSAPYKTISLGGFRYVENLQIQAEGVRGDAIFDVVANGTVKGTIYVPGRDPNYTVTIRDTIDSIQLIHRSGYTARINGIYANMSVEQRTTGVSFDANTSTPAGLGKMVLNSVSRLQETVTDLDFNNFLMPIRKAALRLSASGDGRSLLSNKTEDRAKTLINAITAAEGLIDSLSARQFYAHDLEALLFVREKLQSMYEMN